MSSGAKKQVITDGVVAKPVRDAIDRLFSDVFSTVAFQTAVVCTYAEAIQIAFGGVQHSTADLLDEYVDAVNGLLKPKAALNKSRGGARFACIEAPETRR